MTNKAIRKVNTRLLRLNAFSASWLGTMWLIQRQSLQGFVTIGFAVSYLILADLLKKVEN